MARERFPVVAKPTSLVTQRFVSRRSPGLACAGHAHRAPAPPAPVVTSARRSSARRAKNSAGCEYIIGPSGVSRESTTQKIGRTKGLFRSPHGEQYSISQARHTGPYRRHPCPGAQGPISPRRRSRHGCRARLSRKIHVSICFADFHRRSGPRGFVACRQPPPTGGGRVTSR